MASKHRVVKAPWRGKYVWVKKAIADKSSFVHRLQKSLSKVVSLPFLKPTVNKGGAAALRHEAGHIAVFRSAGFKAPEVLAISDHWIVLEDLGPVIDTEIKTATDMTPQKLSRIVGDCAEEIARLHKSGHSHGRCKLNDLVRLENGGIGFIDFEESTEEIPLPARQARELWLFSMSAARYLPMNDNLIADAMTAYKKIYSSEEIFAELRRFLRFAKPFTVIMAPFAKVMGGDAYRAHAATRKLLVLAEQGL